MNTFLKNFKQQNNLSNTKFIKMKNLLMTIFCLFSLTLFGQDNTITTVGEEVKQVYESPHPYAGAKNNTSEIVWSEAIVYKEASYIAVHFSKVQLSKGDFIIVRSPDGKRSWKYQDLSVDSKSQGFWSINIYGEKAIVEIHSKNKAGSYGYSIDKIARGYTDAEMEDQNFEAICASDDSKEAKCYQSSETTVYNKSKAVARLLINGTGFCTGWLIGSEGHLMTNNHCILNANDANNVTVEFMAEGSNCSSDCRLGLACTGTIEATSATLIQTDVALDYSLLKLPVNVSSTYGYLQFRNDGPVLNERIYIPQHPSGWGKRIAIESDVDPTGFSSINSLTEPRCGGFSGNDVGYFADTRGGSSGSPVISYDDHLVVALHHCANCLNRGVASNLIIDDLGTNLPPNAVQIFGCTNLVACNYNPDATIEDGSCDYGNPACPYPCNWLSCFLPTGCTSPIACNYDPGAIFDDGSCDYGNILCADPCGPCFVIDFPWWDPFPVIPVLPPDDPCLFPPCGDICLSCPNNPLINPGINPLINPGIDPLINPGIDPLINIGGPKLGSTEAGKNSANAFTVFPNPTNGKVTISLDQESTEPHTLFVFNLNGKVIRQNIFIGSQINLDLSNIAKGMYMIKIQNDENKNSINTQKLLVK